MGTKDSAEVVWQKQKLMLRWERQYALSSLLHLKISYFMHTLGRWSGGIQHNYWPIGKVFITLSL